MGVIRHSHMLSTNKVNYPTLPLTAPTWATTQRTTHSAFLPSLSLSLLSTSCLQVLPKFSSNHILITDPSGSQARAKHSTLVASLKKPALLSGALSESVFALVSVFSGLDGEHALVSHAIATFADLHRFLQGHFLNRLFDPRWRCPNATN